jgi:hypothetical protein
MNPVSQNGQLHYRIDGGAWILIHEDSHGIWEANTMNHWQLILAADLPAGSRLIEIALGTLGASPNITAEGTRIPTEVEIWLAS